MRMAIMGGTLDPVHNGHLQIAQAVKEACGLDGILLLPAGDPPHKQLQIDRFDRLEMARRAAQSQPGMMVSDIEIMREGTTFTVDTLTQLRAQQPNVEWVYIIGADTVRVLDKWRNFEKVAALCEFAAVGRPGFDIASVQEWADALERDYGAKVRLLDVCGPDISSTDVRNAVAEGRSVDHLVPPSVAEYIREKGLYLCGMPIHWVKDRLRSTLKPSRYEHTLGVAETAERLAPRYDVDPKRAYLAGLLHDCAKWMSYEDMVELVRGNVSDVTEDELANEPVLHAPAGMLVAQRDYGVRDPEILSAIRKHAVGSGGMTALEKLIYTADFVEPNRKPFPGLEEARSLAETNLNAATKKCAQLTHDHVISCGGTPDPRSQEIIDEAEIESIF